MRHRFLSQIGAYLCLFIFVVNPLQAAKLFDKSAKKQLTAYLDESCQWILTENPGVDKEKGNKSIDGHLAVQGMLARMLLAGYELTKDNARYRDYALEWGDRFIRAQEVVKSSQGNEAGFWKEPAGSWEVDLASSSAAAVALARLVEYADGARKKSYQSALERYARFLLEGVTPQPGEGLVAVDTWISSDASSGKALRRGITGGKASQEPSTLATAASSSFWSHLYRLSGNKEYRELASGGVRWIFGTRKGMGDIPQLENGDENGGWPVATFSYCSEAFLAGFYLLDDASLAQSILQDSEPTVRWLLRIQDDRGVFGEGPDHYRSPAAANYLAWYYLNSKSDESIPQSLDKFFRILLNPVHSQSFGVQMQASTTAWVGLCLAEMIKPGITFKKN
ncbi:MAG: hypothetical protein AB1898_03650 [Acidobacteriota bacterium]